MCEEKNKGMFSWAKHPFIWARVIISLDNCGFANGKSQLDHFLSFRIWRFAGESRVIRV